MKLPTDILEELDELFVPDYFTEHDLNMMMAQLPGDPSCPVDTTRANPTPLYRRHDTQPQYPAVTFRRDTLSDIPTIVGVPIPSSEEAV